MGHVEVQVRRLGEDESLLAAALHLQSLHAAAVRPDPGQLDRYADTWSAAGDALPQWVAQADGAHCGTMLLRAPVPLPPGVDSAPGVAQVVLLYVVSQGRAADEGAAGRPGSDSAPTREQVQVALLRTGTHWARGRGLTEMELAGGVEVQAEVLQQLCAAPTSSPCLRIPC